MRRLSTFKRGFLSTFALDVVARGMSAVTTVLLLRALDVEDFAFVVLIMSLGQFLGGAATGGIRMRYVRKEAERVSRGASGRGSFWVTLRAGSLLVLGAGVLGFVVATALDVGDSATQRATFLGIGIAYTLAHATVELSVFHHQAQLQFLRGGLISVARSTVMLGCALAATLGALESGAAVGLAFVLTVGTVALVAAAPIAWQTRHSIAGMEGRFGFGSESASLTVYSIASAGWAYVTVFLVAALLDDTAVASYGAAARYISVVVGPVPALVSVIRVRTAQADMVDSGRKQVEMMRNWALRVGPLAFLVLGAAAIAAPFVIPIVDGGRYPLSITLFEIKLIGAFAQLVTLPNPAMLLAQNRYTLLAAINGSALVVNIALAVIAAPLFGAVGVVSVTAAVTIAQVVAVTYFAARPPGGTAPSTRPSAPQELAAAQSAPEPL